MGARSLDTMLHARWFHLSRLYVTLDGPLNHGSTNLYIHIYFSDIL